MKYTIQRLDGRYAYCSWFQYYIGFSKTMGSNQGPLHFNHCLKWFVQTYGWSAEIRQYDEIYRWIDMNQFTSRRMIKKFGNQAVVSIPDLPDSCNPNWSWTNSYQELRIYVASDKELSWFQISNKMVS